MDLLYVNNLNKIFKDFDFYIDSNLNICFYNQLNPQFNNLSISINNNLFNKDIPF